MATSKYRRYRRLSSRLQSALTALDDAISADGKTRAEPSFPANVKVVAVEKWREHFYRYSDDVILGIVGADPAGRDQTGATLKAFVLGLLEHSGEYASVTKPGKKVSEFATY